MSAAGAGRPPRSRLLVLGLGNPGDDYRETRHNLGFRVVGELGRRRGIAMDRRECNALLGAANGLILACPQTYMNRSGYAARCLAERYAFQPDEILAVYDEVQLPLGRLRLRSGGSPGGHRGMESIVENLRTDSIPRLRLGIGGEGRPPEGEDLVEYVLAPFRSEERAVVEEMIQRAADAVECWISEGLEAAMSRFNA